MKKIPRSVKVGTYKYKVKRPKVIEIAGVDCDGYFNHLEGEILVKRGLPATYAWVVLIHECIHGMEFAYNLSFTEKEMDVLDHALVAFLRDNKLVDF